MATGLENKADEDRLGGLGFVWRKEDGDLSLGVTYLSQAVKVILCGRQGQDK